MPAYELLIAIVAFFIFPVVFLAAGAIFAVLMKPPPEEPLYRLCRPYRLSRRLRP